jgi:hypothetical protein
MLMMIRTSAKWMCMLLLINLSTDSATADESIALIEEVFAIQRQQLLTLNSIDMSYSEKIEYGERLRKSGASFASQGDRFRVSRYCLEGEKFRSESGLEGSLRKPDEIAPTTYAFDLKDYQIYDQDDMHLTIPGRAYKSMEMDNIPYQNTYKWLFQAQKDYSLSGFQDKAAWDKLKEHVRDVKLSTVQDQACVVMEFDFPERNQYMRVCFAEEFSYFPFRIEVFQGDARMAEHLVTSLEKVETTEGVVIVPLITDERQWYETGQLYFRITHVIDKDKLFVNVDIPDAVFTIPRHTVWSYTNMLDKPASFYINDLMAPTGIDDASQPPTPVNEDTRKTEATRGDYQESADIVTGNAEVDPRLSGRSVAVACSLIVAILAISAGVLLHKRSRNGRVE